MRILFVGIEDIAGKYIAERFYKEGHKIFLLTEEDSPSFWDSNIKIVVYKSILTSNRCKKIFKGNSIDIVIFMTGEYRDRLSEGLSYHYQSMVPNLMNILRISFESKVEKFVFLSSTELDNIEPFPPILADLKFGEDLCRTWEKSYNLPVLITRISSIYGIAPYEYMGYTGNIIKRMVEKEHIRIEKNRLSHIDLIYGVDAADGIYRAVLEKATGLYHVYSNRPITLEEYTSCIREVFNFKEGIKFTESVIPEVSINAKADDNRLRNELGWIPMHDFREKGKEILDRAKEYNRGRKKQKEIESVKQTDQNKKFVKFRPMVKASLENILLFIFSCFLMQFTRESSDFRFVDIRLVYVVIVASIYGLKQGLLATVLACISYGHNIINSGIDLTYLIYSIDTWTPFIMYLIVGSGVGYSSDKKTDDKEAIIDESHVLTEKYNFLKEIYQEVCEVKDQLQRQIIVSKDSFGRVYDITKELDSFKPELIFFKAVYILEDIMECKEVCIYTVNHEYFKYARLMANSSALAGVMEGSMNLDDFPEMKKSLENKKVFVNKNLLENYPAYAAPIMDGGNVVAVAIINRVDFEKFTAYYKNLFEIIIGMIQNNLVRAYRYCKDVSDKRYIGGTEILISREYKEQLKIMEDAKEGTQIFYLQMTVSSKDEEMDFIEFAHKVVKLLRNTDFVGCDESGIYHVVFMQTKMDSIELLKNRFDSVGLVLTEEDGAHG